MVCEEKEKEAEGKETDQARSEADAAAVRPAVAYRLQKQS